MQQVILHYVSMPTPGFSRRPLCGYQQPSEDPSSHIATYADRDIEKVLSGLQCALMGECSIWSCKECKEHSSLPTLKLFAKGITL